jgi:hypothetical protein
MFFIILFSGLFVLSNGVLINEQNREMIKEAIAAFVHGPATCPIVVMPSFPVVNDEWRPDRERYTRLPYILFHPLIQFPLLFRNSPIYCPICQKDGVTTILTSTKKWRDGSTKRTADQPRMLYGINSPVLLVSKVYKCSNGHKEVPANDPEIIKLIPVSYLPFMLTHQSGLTTALLQFLEDLIDSGVSIGAIESMIHGAYKRNLSSRETRFWTDSRLAYSSSQEILVDLKCPFPEFEHYPSSHFLTDVLVSNFHINEDFYRKYFSSLSATWISCDHTFKSAMNVGYFRYCDNKWVDQYHSLFCILNEIGQVIQWQLTAGESFEEVRTMFIDIKKRLDRKGTIPKGVFIDDCCKWRAAVNSVFPEVPVRLDLFHAVQRIVKKIPKGQKLSKDMANDVGLIFRARNDLGEKRNFDTPKPTILIENLRKFEEKWENPKYKNGTNILSEEIKKEIKKLTVHVEKGCLSDIPPSCSTSKNERLHKDLNKIVRSSRLGVELAYARIFRTLYYHNLKKDPPANNIYRNRALTEKDAYRKDVNSGIDLETVMPLEIKNLEVFGIRSKIHGYDTASNLNDARDKKVNEFDYNVLMDIRNSLQSWMQTTDYEYDREDKNYESTILYELLNQALGWWAAGLTLESLMGKRGFNKQKVQSIARARLNTSTIGLSKPSIKPSVGKTWDEESNRRLYELAAEWGFSIVDMPKNGNCLFTAVGFQLQQFLSTNQIPMVMRNYLENIGLKDDLDLDEISAVLRNLVVDEWIGPNTDDYLDFFHVDSKVNFIEHAKTYRISGTFASELGDAMPLALANVLGMPLVILSTQNFSPFLDICPREVKHSVLPIYLCYYPNGGGHYDALIQNECESLAGGCSDVTTQPMSTENENDKTIDGLVKNPNSTPPSERSCRCGANAKKKKPCQSTRRYSARCPCIKTSGICNPACKCSGLCGGSECRDLELMESQKQTTARKSRKRGIQNLQSKTHQNAKVFLDKKKEKIVRGKMNAAELYLLHTIINHVQYSQNSTMKNAYQLYVDIAKMIEESSHLSVLPIRHKDKCVINKAVRKIVKDEENFDSFANLSE